MFQKNLKNKTKKFQIHFTAFILGISLFLTNGISSFAVIDYNAEAENRKNLPIQSNAYENWPDGPAIGAEAAIVMDADSGAILYEKNIHETLYPASTTKILTCLLAVENCSMDEMVDFSYDAVFGVPRDGSNMGIDVGESLPMEDCLYGILVGSANEVAAAVGEHIGKDTETFVQMMNDRAKELGCLNTNFVNANGLHDENHYTTAYDLALIAKAFFANEYLANMANVARVHFEPTETQPDDFYLNNKNKLISGEIKYEYYVGGKTGYTGAARQTLVSCAEKDGMRLICVIMKEETPNQFHDTVTLFNYGFSNFKKLKVSELETKYTVENAGFFSTGQDIFGSSKSILQLDENAYITIPASAEFEDVVSSISYDNLTKEQVANIEYTYNGVFVGSASVNLVSNTDEYEFTTAGVSKNSMLVVNVKKIVIWILVIAVILSVIIFAYRYINQYHFGGKKGRLAKKRRKRKPVQPVRTVRSTRSSYRKFNFDDIDLSK